MSRASVVVVSRSLLLKKFLEINLSLEGHKVSGVDSAEAVLELGGSKAPSAIIVDLQNMGGDPLALVRKLRRKPSLRSCVILATGDVDQIGAERLAIAAGCDGFVADAFRLHELRGLLRSYLAVSQKPVAPARRARSTGRMRVATAF